MPREIISDFSMLERLIVPAGKGVVDIGCGSGALVRDLARLGARPIGVEVSNDQLSAALALEDGGNARYLVGSAQELPLPDASMDVAVFMRSLHHIPPADLTQALREARRVLRADGVVYVAEPLPEGTYFALTRLVEDELEVRAAAQRALAEAGQAGLKRTTSVEYEVRLVLADVSAFRDRSVSVDPSRAEIFARREAELAAAFDRAGEPGKRPGERRFAQPMRADVLRPAVG